MRDYPDPKQSKAITKTSRSPLYKLQQLLKLTTQFVSNQLKYYHRSS